MKTIIIALLAALVMTICHGTDGQLTYRKNHQKCSYSNGVETCYKLVQKYTTVTLCERSVKWQSGSVEVYRTCSDKQLSYNTWEISK